MQSSTKGDQSDALASGQLLWRHSGHPQQGKLLPRRATAALPLSRCWTGLCTILQALTL